MATTKQVKVEVSADGLASIVKLAERLVATLDQAEKPRKIRAASAALPTSGPQNTGLTRGTAAAGNRGDARDFSRQAQGLGGLVHLYATYAANIYAVGAAFTALSKAADFTNMEKAADILSTKVGTSIRGIAKDMKSLTDGAISMSDALAQSSLAASAGLSSKQISELTTVAKGASIALGRDMTDALQRVFRGTIKIEPELLDELGLMVKVDDANKAYAKTLNKTVSTLTDYERRQAFVNAVTTQGIDKYKELANQSANPFSKLLSSVQDLGTSMLSMVTNTLGPFIALLSSNPTALLAGLAAMASLLFKSLIPAIGQLRNAWQEERVAQEATLKRYGDNLAKVREESIRTAEAQSAATRAAVLSTREALEKTLDTSSIGGSKATKALLSSIKALTWGTTAAAVEAAKIAGGTALADLSKKLDKEISAREAKIKRTESQGTGTTGAYANQKTLDKAYIDLARDRELRDKRILGLNQQLAATASAQVGHFQEIARLSAHNPAVDSINKQITGLQRAANLRNMLTGPYDTTANLGMIAGFKELGNTLATNVGQAGKLRLVFMALQGSFGILTTAASKLVGVFSTWMMVFTIVLPLLGKLTDWLGWTGEKGEAVSEAVDKMTTSLKTFSDIQTKLASNSSLKDSFELQAASALALSTSINDVTAAYKKTRDLHQSGEHIGSLIEYIKQDFGVGQYDEKAQLETIKVYDKAKEAGLLPNAKLVNFTGGKEINSSNFETQNATIQNTVTKNAAKYLSEISDTELEALSKYNKEATSVGQNLKELSDISSEYSRTLVNQSKELKAINAISSIAGSTFKNLFSKFNKDSSASISQLMSGLSSEFQVLSNTHLPDTLVRLGVEMKATEDATKRYEDSLRSLGKKAGETDKEFEDRVSTETGKFQQAGRKLDIKNAGGIDKVTSELAVYTAAASKALASFSLATSNAAVAQAKISRNLRTLGTFTKLAGVTGTSTQTLADQRTEASKVSIERRVIRSNAEAINAQINKQQTALAGYIKAAKEGGLNITGNETTDINTILSDTTEAFRGIKEGTLGASTSLDSLRAQATMLSNNLKVLNLGLEEANSKTLTNTINAASNQKDRSTNELNTTEYNKTKERSSKYNPSIGIGVAYATELKSYEDTIAELQNATNRTNIDIEEQKSILQGYSSAQLQSLIPGITPKEADQSANMGLNRQLDLAKAQPVSVDSMTLVTQIENAIRDINTKIRVLEQDSNLKESEKKLTTNIENTRKQTVNSTQLNNNTALLTTQVDLYSQIAEYTIQTSEDYSKIGELNRLQVSSLEQQLSIEKSILDNIIKTETKKIDMAGKDNPEGKIDAEQAIIKAKQNFTASQLKGAAQLTDMYKQQHDLNLKIMEESGNWKELFTGKGLQEAATIMANRIEETMGKSKSAMSQLAVGLVDAADTITDSFTTMLQKMDETKVTWVAFRDMVRNTLSDMFRNMASDMLKNQVKKMMLGALGKFGLNTETDAQKAANKLGINTDSMKLSLSNIDTNIALLVNKNMTSIYKDTEGGPGNTAADINTRYNREFESRQEQEQQEQFDKFSQKIDDGIAKDYASLKDYTKSKLEKEITRLRGTLVTTTPLPTPSPVLSTDISGISGIIPPSIERVDLATKSDQIIKLLQEYKPSSYNYDSTIPRTADTTKNSIDPINPLNAIDVEQRINALRLKISELSLQILTPVVTTPVVTAPVVPAQTTELEPTWVDKMLSSLKNGWDSFLNLFSSSEAKATKIDKESGKTLTTYAKDVADSSVVTKMAIGGLVGAIMTGNWKGAAAGVASGVATNFLTTALTTLFKANGGIVGPLGDMPVHKFATGGIASSPQLAVFGEGSKNEAFVPLPDNRSIPVTLKGGAGGTSMGDVNISINVNNSNGKTDTSMSVEQSKNLSQSMAGAIRATVQDELMKQMRPRGLLHG